MFRTKHNLNVVYSITQCSSHLQRRTAGEHASVSSCRNVDCTCSRSIILILEWSVQMQRWTEQQQQHYDCLALLEHWVTWVYVCTVLVCYRLNTCRNAAILQCPLQAVLRDARAP
eukprot:scpid71094/ scgid10347/ 